MPPGGVAPGGVAPGGGVAGSCAPGSIHVAHARARQLLGGSVDRPTAVFAASDEMAIGTILAARDFGLRVPYDLSVTGIDGHELGEVIGLTTIDQDALAPWLSLRCRVPAQLIDPAPRGSGGQTL